MKKKFDDLMELGGIFLLIIVVIVVEAWDKLVAWWKLPPMPKNNQAYQWA